MDERNTGNGWEQAAAENTAANMNAAGGNTANMNAAGGNTAKEKTGWWKIVMLVLTCVITLTLILTGVFAAIGATQTARLANIMQYEAALADEFEYFAPDEDYDGEYYSEDEIDWDELFRIFGGGEGSDQGSKGDSSFYDGDGDGAVSDSGSGDLTDEELISMFSNIVGTIIGGTQNESTQVR